MDKKAIFERVKKVFEDFFEDDGVVITEDTSMDNLAQWESIAHIQLIFEIEEEFDIQFEADEITKLNTVEKIVSRIESMV